MIDTPNCIIVRTPHTCEPYQNPDTWNLDLKIRIFRNANLCSLHPPWFKDQLQAAEWRFSLFWWWTGGNESGGRTPFCEHPKQCVLVQGCGGYVSQRTTDGFRFNGILAICSSRAWRQIRPSQSSCCHYLSHTLMIFPYYIISLHHCIPY